MELLPSEERDDCMDVFGLLDSNRNNYIDLNELGPGLRALGLNPSMAEIKSLMMKFDKDENSQLTLEEFAGVYKDCLSSKGEKEKELREQFEKLDRNHDGQLSVNELRELLIQGDEAFIEEEIQMTFAEFDLNQDGFIEINEFLSALLSR